MFKTMGVSVVIGAALGKDYFSTLDTAERRAKKIGTALQETNKKLAATKELAKYRQQLQALREKQAQVGTSSDRLNRGIAEVERRYRRAKSEAKQYGITVGNLVQKQKELSRESERYTKTLTRQANQQQAAAKLRDLRGRMLGVGGALYGAGRMIGASMTEEEQGLYLGTVINARDGNRDAAVGRSIAHARAFSRGTLANSSEMLDIEYALNSAGLSEDVSRAGSELVHKLAKVTRGAPEQVGEIFATTFNNLGAAMEGSIEEKMDRIGNVLAKTQFKFQIRDFNQLGESMKYAAASMASAKVPLEQGAAVIGQLNTAGLQGSMAGTAFNGVLRNMTKAADELGFELVRSADGSMDLIATLQAMKESLDGMDLDEKNDLLQELFGDEGKRGVVPLINQLDQLKEAYADVQKEADRGRLVGEEYARFARSAGGQLTMTKQNLIQIGTVLGGTVLPAINLMLTPIAWLFGKVAWAIEKFPMLGWALGGLAAGFTAAGVAQAFMAAKMWLLNSALLANPVVWVVAGVVALGLAIAALWKNWDKVWSWMQEKALAVGRAIKKVFDNSPIGLMLRAGRWVGEKIGDAVQGGKTAAATTAAAATLAATPLPADSLPSLPDRSTTINTTNESHIQIVQQPGQDAEELARIVDRKLTERDRRAASDYRGRLHD